LPKVQSSVNIHLSLLACQFRILLLELSEFIAVGFEKSRRGPKLRMLELQIPSANPGMGKCKSRPKISNLAICLFAQIYLL